MHPNISRGLISLIHRGMETWRVVFEINYQLFEKACCVIIMMSYPTTWLSSQPSSLVHIITWRLVDTLVCADWLSIHMWEDATERENLSLQREFPRNILNTRMARILHHLMLVFLVPTDLHYPWTSCARLCCSVTF